MDAAALGVGLHNDVVMWDDGAASSLTALQHGLQQALADVGVRVVHRQRTGFTRVLARSLAKLKLVRPLVPHSDRRSLTVLSWASEARAFPDTYWRQLVPWIFDCWEPDFSRWEALLRRHRIRVACFTARDAARHFAQRIPGLEAVWVPEACNPAVYQPQKPLRQRAIGVLEPGRRWETIHERIRQPLAQAGVVHRYESTPQRKRLYGTTEELYAAFGDSQILLCFPKALTHPAEAGCVTTMTQRYLEAIGSGCLPVGRAPEELIDLFGFNPVIELSMTDPAGHLLSIVADTSRYQELTSRSLARLAQVGTFAERAQRIVAALQC